MAVALTRHHEALLAALRNGDEIERSSENTHRLLTLRRRGLVTRERTSDGDRWALATPTPKRNERKRRSRKRATSE